ncbi:MAG TPA: pyridoxamine 5'-phosphate oxidase family protein [Gaiellaceae bacterium]
MGKIHAEIDERLAGWLESQHLFFVATAPLAADGHVNVSPKGDLRWFRILGPREVAYLDFVGSGAETIAHARENGRIVVMLCAFEGPPRIVRLHGRASVTLPEDPGFEELAARFDPPEHAVRSVVRIAIERIADSCGYGVPLMRFDGKRSQYDQWVDKQVRDGGLDTYVAEKNAESIDGLPAI